MCSPLGLAIGAGAGRVAISFPSNGLAHLRWPVALAAAGTIIGCGHAIAPGIPFQHAPRFDFRQPPACVNEATTTAPQAAEGEPGEEVVVRYLGAGGLYVSWRGEAFLTGPFFSNPGLWRAAFGRLRPDLAALRRGLEGIPAGSVGAVLAGHSHYDHVGDFAALAGELGARPAFYLNRSGALPLATAPELGPRPAERIRILEELEGSWTRLQTARGELLPFRILVLPSHHAPHWGPIKLWKGQTKSGRTWHRLRYRDLKEGRTYAFVIDLLGPGEEETADGVSPVLFRIYYQDSAADAGRGFPPESRPGEPAYDLAVLCMPSARWVKDYPEALLSHIAPRHALAIHYEDFFCPWSPRRGFVPLLTRRQADAFLRRADGALAAAGVAGSPPVGPVCGPSAARWTMPLTGEWLRFRPSKGVSACETR